MTEQCSKTESSRVSELFSSESRHKRQRLLLKSKAKKKHCITYDKVNGKDSNEHFETEDTKREVNV